MLFFGHVGLSLGAGKLLERLQRRIDFLFLGLGAIFPDVDKLLSVALGIGGRAFFHTLVFAIALTAVALALRTVFLRSFALGVWLHLLFDTMWTFPQTFFWPFLGSFNSETFNADVALHYFFVDSFILTTEIAGFAIVMWLVYKEKLYKKHVLIDKMRKKRT